MGWKLQTKKYKRCGIVIKDNEFRCMSINYFCKYVFTKRTNRVAGRAHLEELGDDYLATGLRLVLAVAAQVGREILWPTSFGWPALSYTTGGTCCSLEPHGRPHGHWRCWVHIHSLLAIALPTGLPHALLGPPSRSQTATTQSSSHHSSHNSVTQV